MQYPLISEYMAAIRDAHDNLEQLSHLVPVMDKYGEPYRSGGAFAVVFKMQDEQTGKCYALKCFTEEQEGRAEAYRQIAEELEFVDSPYVTSVKYLENELFVDSSCGDDEFPVLLMDWVEGDTMEAYIAAYHGDSHAMSMLCYRFCKLAAWLRSQPFAHGDIKPDNIMVRPDGTLTLVDYDGMFVPAMKGQKSPTIGTKDFSHPLRTIDDFDETIDDFALASIALSLKAISLDASLLEQYGAPDRLLFSATDYLNLSTSKAFAALQSLLADEEMQTLLSMFLLANAKKYLSMCSFRLFSVQKPKEEEVWSTEVTKEDLENAVEDESAVKYSKDWKRLLRAPTELRGEYAIREGVKAIGDNAFYNCNKLMKKTILIVCLGLVSLGLQAQSISLAGEWNVELGKSGSAFAKSKRASQGEVKRAILPGTIDTNHLGFAPKDTMETTHLTRLYAYKGAARYSRTINIPKDWKKKPVELFLERTRPTWVYVDGELVDSCNFISTPQRYLLPKKVKPGKHLLEIVVDNGRGVPDQVYGSSHAYTEDTQTNWNGIIGEIRLEVKSEERRVKKQRSESEGKANSNVLPDFAKDFHIEGAHFYANGHRIFLRGKHDAAVWPLTGHVEMSVEGWMKYLGTCKEYGINHVRFHSWCPPEAAFVAADSLGIYLQPELPFWGSFDKKDEKLMTFLHQEGVNILREYGHHPSFRMMALGNELWGDIDKMKEFVDDFRKIAPDKYYTFGSNYYLGYQGIKEGMDYFTTCRIGGEGWGKYNTHTRGSFSFADAYDGGMINHFHPNSTMNFDEACDKAGIPIISHETGQFQTYPDYREMKKYTGVLHPYNFEVFRKRLAAAGMLSQADDFHKASGLWSVKLYKADIEMDLRTRNMAGFQLLDIQDYPGQGSAFVGILDAFMESKGITTPEEWRQWCSPVVPLLEMKKFSFEDGEKIQAKVKVANYGGSSLKGKKLKWHLAAENGLFCMDDGTFSTKDGEVRKNVGDLMAEDEGVLNIFSYDEGLVDVGELNGVFHVQKPTKLLLTLNIEGTEARNSYELWVYPKKALEKKGVIIAKDLNQEVVKVLEKGGKVLWMPTASSHFVAADDTLSQADNATPYTVGGLFQTDYWNYRMFKTICENNKKKVSPGTLGILTDPEHPIYKGFPTEMHTNWQWFPVIKESHPLVLDNFAKDYRPIVQVIDNIERNHKLGLVMEWKVGAGKLLVCMSDLEKAAKYPEGKAFYQSVIDYMRSASFNPSAEITVDELKKKLAEKPRQVSLKELNNISQY